MQASGPLRSLRSLVAVRPDPPLDDEATRSLPPELRTLVYRCMRASGLRGSGHIPVARELVAHLLDAMAAGRPIERIVQDFGDPERAGLLIRRVRTPVSRVMHRVSVAVALLGIVAGGGMYAVSAVELHSGTPVIGTAAADLDDIRRLADQPIDLVATGQLIDRIVARMYTDDGRGDGALTAQGLRIVQRLKGIERASAAAVVIEPIYFAFPASRREIEREAQRVLQVAASARAAGTGSPAWHAFEREVDRVAWSRPDAYRFVPLAIVLPRLAIAMRRSRVTPS